LEDDIETFMGWYAIEPISPDKLTVVFNEEEYIKFHNKSYFENNLYKYVMRIMVVLINLLREQAPSVSTFYDKNNMKLMVENLCLYRRESRLKLLENTFYEDLLIQAEKRFVYDHGGGEVDLKGVSIILSKSLRKMRQEENNLYVSFIRDCKSSLSKFVETSDDPAGLIKSVFNIINYYPKYFYEEVK